MLCKGLTIWLDLFPLNPFAIQINTVNAANTAVDGRGVLVKPLLPTTCTPAPQELHGLNGIQYKNNNKMMVKS